MPRLTASAKRGKWELVRTGEIKNDPLAYMRLALWGRPVDFKPHNARFSAISEKRCLSQEIWTEVQLITRNNETIFYN
jgi:hypothetical protein